MLDKKLLEMLIERQKQHQRNLANTEGRAVQETEGSEIANVVDDLASDKLCRRDRNMILTVRFL